MKDRKRHPRKKKTLLEELHEEVAANPAMSDIYQRELARLQIAKQILQARKKAR